MQLDANILELKFYGNNIHPAAVKASEIGDILKGFEAAILSIVFEQYPELNKDFPFITISEIGNRSIGLKHVANKYHHYIIPAYMLIADCLSANSYNNLPIKTIEELRVLTRFAKRHNCDGALLYGGEQIGSFHSNTEIVIDDTRYVRGETTIYGILNRIGGTTPSLQLNINNKYQVTFEIKKTIAVKLASKLYKEIGLVGVAKWDKVDYRIVDFKAEDIVDIEDNQEPNLILNSFKELSNSLGKYYDKIDDLDAYIPDYNE